MPRGKKEKLPLERSEKFTLLLSLGTKVGARVVRIFLQQIAGSIQPQRQVYVPCTAVGGADTCGVEGLPSYRQLDVKCPVDLSLITVAYSFGVLPDMRSEFEVAVTCCKHAKPNRWTLASINSEPLSLVTVRGSKVGTEYGKLDTLLSDPVPSASASSASASASASAAGADATNIFDTTFDLPAGQEDPTPVPPVELVPPEADRGDPSIFDAEVDQAGYSSKSDFEDYQEFESNEDWLMFRATKELSRYEEEAKKAGKPTSLINIKIAPPSKVISDKKSSAASRDKHDSDNESIGALSLGFDWKALVDKVIGIKRSAAPLLSPFVELNQLILP